MKYRTNLFLLLLLMAVASLPASAAAQRVEFILDGSGSMWGRVGNETKIEAAAKTGLPASVR